MSEYAKGIRSIIIHMLSSLASVAVYQLYGRPEQLTLVMALLNFLLLLSLIDTMVAVDEKAKKEDRRKSEFKRAQRERLVRSSQHLVDYMLEKRKRKNDEGDYFKPDITTVTGDDYPLATFKFSDELISPPKVHEDPGWSEVIK